MSKLTKNQKIVAGKVSGESLYTKGSKFFGERNHDDEV